MKKSYWIVVIIILLSFGIGIYFYPQMTNSMVSHWSVQGEINGYISKFWGLFLMPIVSLGLFLLFLLIPKIDPLKENIEKFRKYFDRFVILVILFLFYIYILTILWNLKVSFTMNYATIPASALLFLYWNFIGESQKKLVYRH